MVRLEDLAPDSLIRGILPDAVAELVSAKWHGSDVIEAMYKDATGRPSAEILLRDREPGLEIVSAGRPWCFDGDVLPASRLREAAPRDAEQVGACAFAGGKAEIEVGSIDQPGIQKTIVSSMEGGHEAFARRKEIYQPWKQ